MIDLSKKVKHQIQINDPFIQKMTMAVCSKCEECCCIKRYSYYNCDDLIYIMALDLRPQKLQSGDDAEPCAFLTSEGCCLERFVRPSGCTWYFCDTLHQRMLEEPDKAYSDHSDNMEMLFTLWLELICEFRTTFKYYTGCDLEAVDLASDSYRKA